MELSSDLRAEVERVGTAEIAVGLATAGLSPALPTVAQAVRAGLDAHFPGRGILIHVDQAPSDEATAGLARAVGNLRTVHARPLHALHSPDAELEWSDAVHTVLGIGRLVEARAIVMLNADIASMTPEWPAALAEPVLKEGCGLVLPVYQRHRYDGTLTQSLVSPFVRALFGRQLYQPLADEFACSAQAAELLLKQDVWDTDLGQHGLEFWLPIAAIEHDLALGQAVLGLRTMVQNGRPAPLGPTVGRVAGALFALAEGFETLWLDVRRSEPVRVFGTPPDPLVGGPVGPVIDPGRMQVGFRQGVKDLLPIWERIVAPENLGDLLALSEYGPGEFRFPDRLWARIVYDFLLAYRTRVIYRSHLTQSLAPLYLGRAASLVIETQSRPPRAVLERTDELGRVFEQEKPYLVDRWA